ncbi:MAG: hypothetical protein ACLP53_06370 [Isosphaeraceae bacterium]
MTFEQCKTTLSEIRRQQGTDYPLVQIACSGTVIRGRLNRTDTDRPPRSNHGSPYGLLVLEQPGLVPGPLTFVQIASIPEDGLKEDATPGESKVKATKLVAAGRR